MNFSQIVVSYFNFVEKDVFKSKFLIGLISLSTSFSLGLIFQFGISYFYGLVLCAAYFYLMYFLINKMSSDKKKLKSIDATKVELKISKYTHLLDKDLVESYQVERIKRADCTDIELIMVDDFDESHYLTPSGSYVRPNKSVYYLKKRLNVNYFIIPFAYIVLFSMNLIFNTFGFAYFVALF
ncbi:hypothetical protein [Pseudoalteromonas marina]|uniref:Uncharacterized protein n=1 Tax=Pseudoalteromonas marina TaxID=267375 RepID=A0ABT9FHU8_9GAMM|nr:hypothetical protein [Pseudoalteromonas marina]MDP2566367.1 hypothetical protein [Pseudoalteromonas marina]